MSEKYIIVLDTNILTYELEDKLFKIINNNLFDLLNFIEKHKIKENIKLCIPKIVFEEIINRKEEKINKNIEKIKEIKKRLSFLDADFKILEKKDREKKLKKDLQDLIKKNKIIVLDFPKIELKEIIERSCKKTPPFKDQGRGFKDSIIWYSILEDCKKNKNNYFLISNDGDFDKEILSKEFKRCSKKDFDIFKNILDLKDFLIEQFHLNPNLEEEHREIEKEIKEKINNILFEIAGKDYYYSLSKKLIGAFYIKDIVFNNISENGLFVDLTIKTKIKLFESQEEKDNQLYKTAMYTEILKTPYYHPCRYHEGYPEEKDIILNITLSKIGEEYSVQSYTTQDDYSIT